MTRAALDVYRGAVDADGKNRYAIIPGIFKSDDPARRHWKAGYEYTIGNIMGFSHIHSWTMGGLLAPLGGLVAPEQLVALKQRAWEIEQRFMVDAPGEFGVQAAVVRALR